MGVSIADVLDHLVARSMAPSTFGAQLDRLRFGTHSAPDPFRAREDAENSMMEQATLLRCVDEFGARGSLPVTAKAVERICKECGSGQGVVALGVLRAYHEWSTQSQQRGLVEVYRYAASLAPRGIVRPPEGVAGCADLVQMFREGRAKRCASMAAELYADSLLGMQHHIRLFNKRSGCVGGGGTR